LKEKRIKWMTWMDRRTEEESYRMYDALDL